MSTKKLSDKELIEMTDTLAILLGAGIGLYEAMLFFSQNVKSKLSRHVSETLARRLHEGQRLSRALAAIKDYFPPVFIGMMSIGEKTGSLKESLAVLNRYLKSQRFIREKFISALIYPALVFLMALLGSFGLIFFIIPAISEAARELNSVSKGDLELVIHHLDQLSIIMSALLLLIVIALGAHLIGLKRNSSYRQAYHRLLIQAPLLKNFFGLQQYWRLTFYLETLLEGGLTLEQSLKETMQITSNLFLRQELSSVHQQILKGTPIHEAFQHSAFPKEFSLWLAVGSRTGLGALSFTRLKEYYENQFTKVVERLAVLIDPLLICLIGLFMILFVVMVIIPLFNSFTSIIAI